MRGLCRRMSFEFWLAVEVGFCFCCLVGLPDSEIVAEESDDGGYGGTADNNADGCADWEMLGRRGRARDGGIVGERGDGFDVLAGIGIPAALRDGEVPTLIVRCYVAVHCQ